MNERTVVQVEFQDEVHEYGKEKGYVVKAFTNYKRNNLNIQTVNVNGKTVSLWLNKKETVNHSNISQACEFLNKSLHENNVKEVDYTSKKAWEMRTE